MIWNPFHWNIKQNLSYPQGKVSPETKYNLRPYYVLLLKNLYGGFWSFSYKSYVI